MVISACSATRSAGGARIEQNTISWLPASLVVRPLAVAPEAGVNLDLYATLDAVGRNVRA